MKTLQYILSALTLLLCLNACNNKDYDVPNEFSDAMWYTSKSNTNFNFADTMRVGLNSFIAFSDLSRGTVDHSWTIPTSAKFLEGEIENTVKDYTPYIVNDGETYSEEKSISVLFTEASGKNEAGEDSAFVVNLYNTFRDSVSFAGLDTMESVFENGLWTMNTDFYVKVYDTITVEIEIYKENGEKLENIMDSTVTHDIEFGEKIRFVDVTTKGEPDARLWKIGGVEFKDQEVLYTTNAMGRLSVSITSKREDQNLPNESKFLNLPSKINIVKSTKPFELSGEVVEMEDQTIKVAYNGLFETFTSAVGMDAFTVKVNGSDAAISSVLRNEDNNAQIDIKLAETIYSNDVVTVTYTGGLEATDGRVSGGFTDEVVKMHQVILHAPHVPTMEGDMYTPEGTTESNANATYELRDAPDGSGEKVFYMVKTSGPLQMNGKGSRFEMKKGKKYKISFNLWSEVNAKGFKIALFDHQWWTGVSIFNTNQFEGRQLNQWEHYEFVYDKTSDDQLASYFIIQLGNNGPYHLKDLSIEEYDDRPVVE
ncbi:SwmB domain-containing protein [Flammeovirga sp. OC4]|uniref:SwmB domain-containing protein n=1 Tax=Flammeovirga sp. OC4 TaxID=1382345 RepID=UPI0005C6C177|nr:SwmB domain-containing protein [Flammeovirga sp. OC4]